MSKRITTLFFMAALAILASAWLSGAAQAGPGTVCGDGVQEGSESCDDGNTVGGDGCSALCVDEICGDGLLEIVTEECDDGNTVSDDGCSATCTIECGDGVQGPNEDCDDGNGTNGDGCDDDVTSDPPGNCTVTACGNGVITGTEACDDGNTVGGDGCEADCTLTPPTGPQTKPQQKCLNDVNKGGAGVSKAQDKGDAKCLKDAAKGTVADVVACINGVDLSKATAKVTKAFTDKCTGEGLPDFALTDAATVNGANETEPIDAALALLGATPTVAPKADKEDAKCQGTAMKVLNKLVDTTAAELNKGKKTGLKGGKTIEAVESQAELEGVLNNVLSNADPKAKINKAKAGVQKGIDKDCTEAQVDPLFDCGGATTLAALTTCIQDAGVRAACEAMEASDALALTCP